jgi:olfactory receptor
VLLVLASWIISALDSLLQSFMVLRLSFCKEVKMPHYFCETNQLLYLVSSDTFKNNVMMNLAVGLLGVGPLTGILYSYCKSVSSSMKSLHLKDRAFLTCASVLSVVSILFYTFKNVP